MPKNPKVQASKDSPKGIINKTSGVIRFPPHPPKTAHLESHHGRFHLVPLTDIKHYPHHIPYNSNKIQFNAMTGRQGLEVFEYSFRFDKDIDDENDTADHVKGTDWTVRWDYNIGLVKITPFFKAFGLSKTAPNTAIDETPGLKELSISITGGSLVAQGYWIPFRAAKAMAATFCWRIRYALTPVFGEDFLDMCLPLEDPAYSRHTIDHSITEECTKEVKGWTSSKHQTETRRRQARKRVISSPEQSPEPQTPQPRSLRPRGDITTKYPDVDGSDSQTSNTSSASPSIGVAEISTALHETAKRTKTSGWNAVNRSKVRPRTADDSSPSLSSISSSPMMASSIEGSRSTKRTYTMTNEDNELSNCSPVDYVFDTAPKKLKLDADVAQAAQTLLKLRYGR